MNQEDAGEDRRGCVRKMKEEEEEGRVSKSKMKIGTEEGDEGGNLTS